MSIRNYPLFDGNPEPGVWYKLTPAGTTCSHREEYFSFYKKGRTDRLVIALCGGGVILNAEMAMNPSGCGAPETFYLPACDPFAYEMPHFGILSENESNPFRDCSFLSLSFATGDFHCGTGSCEYTDAAGNKTLIQHKGFTNVQAVMRDILPYLGTPEKVLVMGSSAGGFGAAILGRYFCSLFPAGTDFTFCPDSAVLAYADWQGAMRRWQAPEDIIDKSLTENVTADHLLSIHREYPDAKILLCASVRDGGLVKYQNYIDTGLMSNAGNDGSRYQSVLWSNILALRTEIPELGLFFFDKPEGPGAWLTRHMILNCEWAYTYRKNGKTALEWLWNAFENNETEVLGEDLF